MDLEEFVADSLTQIIRAVKSAQERSAGTGAWVNPAGYELPRFAETIETKKGVRAYVHDVEFDVAVTAADAQSAGAKAGLKVFSAELLGAKGKVTYENSAVSRVKFSIPVVWPEDVRAEREKEHREFLERVNKASEVVTTPTRRL